MEEPWLPPTERPEEDNLLQLIKQTFKITLLCHNCTVMQVYEFPVRRRFYGYHPDFIGMEGELLEEQDWSRIGHPRNPEKADLVFCKNCKVPMLTGAPIQLGSNGLQPGAGVVK
jgi:hypothetical protein